MEVLGTMGLSFPDDGCLTSRIPVKLVGVDELHAAFLMKAAHRTIILVPRTGNPGISLVCRVMWGTTALSL